MAEGPEQQSHPRLGNLLAALALGLVDDGIAAVAESTGLSVTGAAALISLAEFLDGQNVGRLSEVLGLSHSGAVRLVAQLEARGLVRRGPGQDRRQVNVVLTDDGRRLAEQAATARMGVVADAVSGLGRGGPADLGTPGGELGREPNLGAATTAGRGRLGRRMVVPDVRLRGLRARLGSLPCRADRSPTNHNVRVTVAL